jgi:hypothetical protein
MKIADWVDGSERFEAKFNENEWKSMKFNENQWKSFKNARRLYQKLTFIINKHLAYTKRSSKAPRLSETLIF